MNTAVPSTTAIDDIANDETVNDVSKRRLGFGFWIAISWIGLVSVAALLAPWLPISDPNEIANGAPRDGILGDNLMGTDALGRDVFARTIWGARISLGVGFLGILLGVVVGGSLGIAAGYFKGLTDQVISFLAFSLLSFPALVLALLITASLSRSFLTVAMTLGIIGIAPISRLARATTIQFADREFVQAARVIGAKSRRIIIKELLPNVLIPMGALTLLGMGISIVAEGSLAFLGLSVEGEAISWGKSIVDGSQTRDLNQNSHVAFVPIFAMFLTVMALNFAGDRIREYTDVRETAF
ncbi:MAG: ABC transporter permease [Acidimicrobiaceae bacterium]|jgi:peptide/nickel transport system permease protein|nr:ABC transporter permease [Acidimicrobiaceae bacterium]HAB57253.1 ABC transporter permease [Acidimicrobiaceae bacterium]